jgi:uncharacterized protein YggU (UPF0235/DUF167 family)
MSKDIHLHSGRAGSAITVRTAAGAARTEITDISADGTLIVSLAVPKMGKKANEALIGFLAELLKVPCEQIEIVAGLTSTDKLITILDLDTATVHKRILKHKS